MSRRTSLAVVSEPDDREQDDELFPEQTADDTDRGWGEHPGDEDDDDERLIREKPPHW